MCDTNYYTDTMQSAAANKLWAAEAEYEAAKKLAAPSGIYRPTLMQDGDAWIALYGEDLATGVVGSGSTPAEAYADFDAAWVRKAGKPGGGA